jgi:hypothetical protein
MAGFLTSNRIWGTLNFCSHTSNFVYVHLMRNFTLEETLLAKQAYEKVLKQAGRTAWHYHADNGRFTDKWFHKDTVDQVWGQNGVVHKNLGGPCGDLALICRRLLIGLRSQ